MLINAQTKISALLKHHPDALEAIVPLSPDFKKLRNPVLRKLMAGRTSIAMASKIGRCTPEDFFEKLKPLGFETDTSKPVEEETAAEQKSIPQLSHWKKCYCYWEFENQRIILIFCSIYKLLQ